MTTSYKRVRRLKNAFHLGWFVAYDFIGAVIAWNIFYYARKYILSETDVYFSMKPLINSLMIGGFWLFLYFLAGFYIDVYRKSRIKEFFLLLVVSFIGCVSLFFALLLDDEGVVRAGQIDHTSYYKTISAYLGIHFVLSAIFKMGVMSYTKMLLRKGKITFNTIIIGSNKKALEIYEELSRINSSLGLRFVGYVYVFPDTKNLLKEQQLRCFGDISVLDRLIPRTRIEQVIIAIESQEHQKITGILNQINKYPVKVSIIPDIYQMLIGSVKVNHVFGVPLIEINQRLMPVWQKVIKRVFDVCFSLIVLILGAPFFIFVGIMTKLSSKGPVFYSQIRIGKDGKPFAIHKFRSMYVNSEVSGPALSSDNDPRITPWGRFMRKTRIDELPQFFNVLLGTMSIVGPRPERKYFIDRIKVQAPHYSNLLRVKPGITSLGQVKYGYAENVDQMVRRLKFDILYLENMSLAMDFRILLFTILIVVQGRGK